MIVKVQNAREKLSAKNLDALLISSASNIGYLTGFFGFSKTEREGYLLVTQNALYFFASGLNSEAIRKHITSDGGEATTSTPPRWTLIVISPRVPLTKKALADILTREKIKRLGFEKQNLTYAEFEKLNDLNHLTTLVATENLIEELRMIKTTGEIATIEKACELGDKAFTYILTKIKTGVSERELAFEIELFIRKAGADISFPSIVAFGKNSSIPHHTTGNTQLVTRNTFVLLDFGVRINNYCSDMTRTVFFGRATNGQKRMYQVVYDSQQKAIELLTKHPRGGRMDSPGVDSLKAKETDKVARDHIISKGYPTIPHSLGHGIGLEVHELPSLSLKSKTFLKPGMVFSIEPGIYLQGVGGVRIEDLVVLESTGPRFLTKANRKLIEI